MTANSINCGQCAHLWRRSKPGFGICACRGRQDTTGQIRPIVSLDATCEFAQLSAKADPEFMNNLRAARQGPTPAPAILTPDEINPALP